MQLLYYERSGREKELDKLHNKSMENIAELMSELNFENLHEYFYGFCYLLWNGFFSVDREYAYNNVDIADEDNTIFLGRGCCRHNAQLLGDLLLLSGNLAARADICTRKMKRNDLMGINRTFEKYEEQKRSLKPVYDHSVVLALSGINDSMFLLDPTNNVECEVIKGRRLVCFGGTYKINKSRLLCELNLSYIKNYSNKTKSSENLQSIKYYYDCAKNICENNRGLIDDFYLTNVSNYEKIKKLVLR